jgi:hypothetical protein
MARAKKAVKAVAAPKRRGRPPKAQAAAIPMPPAPEPGPGYKYRWIREGELQDPVEHQAIELALVRLRRIAASLRLSHIGMDSDHADATLMASELVAGAQEAIAEALTMIREQR